ncbi:hypothetical protein [Azospirillum sp. B506]|uniref:hypothetical protein n=1 Tax=Azospirillum sp. B506 TaxID=137721 RepID=UPI0011DDDECA|nr:hypothetical protein [Azospirillum sp. B506]
MAVLAMAVITPLSTANAAIFGEKIQSRGGYACLSPEFFREIDSAMSQANDRWADAVGECIYLNDGTDLIVIDESGPFYRVRIINPAGNRQRYWMSKSLAKSPCYLAGGCAQ